MRGAPDELCAQCYGSRRVRIQGKVVPCTCVLWDSPDDGSTGRASHRCT